MTPTTCTSNVCLSYVALSVTSTGILTLRSAGKINRARTKHIYVRPVVIEALGKNFSLSLLLIRYTRRWIGGIIIGIVYL